MDGTAPDGKTASRLTAGEFSRQYRKMLMGSGIADDQFGGYSSAAMQQAMLSRAYANALAHGYMEPWRFATATASSFPIYGDFHMDSAIPKPTSAQVVESKPPQVYVTKKFNWTTLYLVCLALMVSMAPVIIWPR